MTGKEKQCKAILWGPTGDALDIISADIMLPEVIFSYL